MSYVFFLLSIFYLILPCSWWSSFLIGAYLCYDYYFALIFHVLKKSVFLFKWEFLSQRFKKIFSLLKNIYNVEWTFSVSDLLSIAIFHDKHFAQKFESFSEKENFPFLKHETFDCYKWTKMIGKSHCLLVRLIHSSIHLFFINYYFHFVPFKWIFPTSPGGKYSCWLFDIR